MIGKVENLERLITILRGIPVIQNNPSWRASLEDDVVQESVSASKAANGHNDNGQETHWPERPGNTSPRSDRSGSALQDVEAEVSSTEIEDIVAQSTQRRAPTRRIRDTSNTTGDAHSASPEIADSSDGRAVGDGTDKCPRPFAFNVFAKSDDELVNDGQPPAKRRCRASSASSSIRTEQARTPPVVNLPHDIELHTGFTRKEEIMDGHEWQVQRIISERQTPSGLEYEVSLEKTLWLPKVTLDTKLVRRYRAEQRAASRVRRRWLSRLQEAGSSVRLQRR